MRERAGEGEEGEETVNKHVAKPTDITSLPIHTVPVCQRRGEEREGEGRGEEWDRWEDAGRGDEREEERERREGWRRGGRIVSATKG